MKGSATKTDPIDPKILRILIKSHEWKSYARKLTPVRRPDDKTFQVEHLHERNLGWVKHPYERVTHTPVRRPDDKNISGGTPSQAKIEWWNNPMLKSYIKSYAPKKN